MRVISTTTHHWNIVNHNGTKCLEWRIYSTLVWHYIRIIHIWHIWWKDTKNWKMGKIFHAWGLFGEFEDWEECWTFFSIWELWIWHQIVVKIEIILIRISHLCIQRKVKNKQNIREKKMQLKDNCVTKYYQSVTIYTKQFYCSFFTVTYIAGKFDS